MINLHTEIDIKSIPISEAHKKIDGVNQIAQHFCSIKNYYECKYCAEAALEMAEAINYVKGVADAKFNLGEISYKQEDFAEAIPLLTEVEKLYESVKELKKQAQTCRTLAISLWNIGDYSEEIEYFFKALHIFRDIGESDFEGDTLNSIGNYYLEIGEHNSALEYYKMSLDIKKKTLDVRGIILTLYNIALTYNNIQSPDAFLDYDPVSFDKTLYGKALKYYYVAFEFNKKLEQDPFLENRIMQNIGLTYTNINRNEEAIEIFQQCIDYFTRIKNDVDRCDTLIYMGTSNGFLKNHSEAEKNFTEANEIAERLNVKRLIMHVNRQYSKYYRDINDFKNALILYKKYAPLNIEKIKTIADNDIRKLNILHKVDITRKETEVLSQKNEDLRSMNMELIKLNNDKNYFLNLVANDLKIPLEKISIVVKNLSTENKEEKSETKKIILAEVLNHSAGMQKIISDLLTINEMETSK